MAKKTFLSAISSRKVIEEHGQEFVLSYEN